MLGSWEIQMGPQAPQCHQRSPCPIVSSCLYWMYEADHDVGVFLGTKLRTLGKKITVIMIRIIPSRSSTDRSRILEHTFGPPCGLQMTTMDFAEKVKEPSRLYFLDPLATATLDYHQKDHSNMLLSFILLDVSVLCDVSV